jgi:hypothetical protein
MKTIFAALASALLVSTAFAQTAAPAPSTPATIATPAGHTDLSTEVQAGAKKTDVSTKKASTETDKAGAEVHAKKKSVVHAEKTPVHKLSQKKQNIEAGADKVKADAGNEAATTPVKAETKTDATGKTQ